jgi:hypothetical protein
MGQHALAVSQQLRPVAADRPTHLPVFLVDRSGFGQQDHGDFLRPPLAAKLLGRFPHSPKGPEQIHRRRAGCGQGVGDLVKPPEEGRLVRAGGRADDRLQSDADPVRRGNADRRGASHAQRPDRFQYGLHVAAIDVDQLGWQPGLVDQLQPAVRVPNPAERFEVFHCTFNRL